MGPTGDLGLWDGCPTRFGVGTIRAHRPATAVVTLLFHHRVLHGPNRLTGDGLMNPHNLIAPRLPFVAWVSPLLEEVLMHHLLQQNPTIRDEPRAALWPDEGDVGNV